MSKIYKCNYKRLVPPVIVLFLMIIVGLVLLLRFTRLTNSIPSIFTLIAGFILLGDRYLHELTLNVKICENGISFKYTKDWRTIKWETIERIEYRRSFNYEWIIIHYPYEQQLILTPYTKQYKELWKEIECNLCKCNSNLIVDEEFMNRTNRRSN